MKSKEISWRCTAKSCTARVRTDENGSMIVQQKNTHNHEANDRENERHALRVRAKRKADDDISQRPSKIIKGELQTMTEEHLQTSNLRCVSKAIYRKRRKTHPPLPKSRQETHESLAKMNIGTNKFENFLQVNDEETGIIIFIFNKHRLLVFCGAGIYGWNLQLDIIFLLFTVYFQGNQKRCTPTAFQL